MAARRRRSKRRSAASCASPKRPEAVYFVDRYLGRRIVPEALRQAGMRVEVHDDHFAADAPDVQWIAVGGQRGWVVLTKDERIRRRSSELTAAREVGADASCE